MSYEHLLSPYAGDALQAPNRVVLAPLTRNRAKGTVPGPLNAEYYAQRAGGALVISEGTHPSAVGQGYIDIPGLHTDAQQEGWRLVADAVHAADGRLFIQIMHCGRIAHESLTGGLQPVAPSAVRAEAQTFTADGPTDVTQPRALQADELPGVVADYVQAAQRAVAAGADGVELHSANGYLLAQFLAENTNRRTDAYGGDVAGRIRFVVEVARAVAEAIGPERVGIRISPDNPFNDIHEEAPQETYAALIPALAELGLAYLHVIETAPDTGWSAVTQARELWPGTLIANAGFGEAFDLDQAEALVRDGGADLVAFGRMFLANPDLPARLQSGAAELNEADEATFYGGDARGYTDYPTLAEARAA
jgi:N-ethylmaleimide reductase